MIFKRAVAKLRAQDWVAILIELLIVTVGVLLALAAQQWAEDRSWSSKVEATRSVLRAELAEHYHYAVEFRVDYPCLQAQIHQLRDRVLASNSTLDPAPLFEEDGAHYVLRIPIKIYPADAWEAAVSDGTIRSFDPALRRTLAGHYAQLPEMADINGENNAAEPAFVALTHPLPLDPTVRYAIIKTLSGCVVASSISTCSMAN